MHQFFKTIPHLTALRSRSDWKQKWNLDLGVLGNQTYSQGSTSSIIIQSLGSSMRSAAVNPPNPRPSSSSLPASALSFKWGTRHCCSLYFFLLPFLAGRSNDWTEREMASKWASATTQVDSDHMPFRTEVHLFNSCAKSCMLMVLCEKTTVITIPPTPTITGSLGRE